MKEIVIKEFVIKNFIDAGLNSELPDFLKRRVKTINIVTLLLTFAAALPFVIFSQFYIPDFLSPFYPHGK